MLPAGGRDAVGAGDVLRWRPRRADPLTAEDIASVDVGRRSTVSLGARRRDRAPPGLGGAGGQQPPRRHAGAPGRPAGRSATAACSARSPTRPRWRSTGPSCASRRCGRGSSRRSTAGAARSMGAASHDLRTPLASIKTAVSSLRQVDARLGAEDRAELLELIELQSDRLARLVTNLLDMTRIEAGALELRPQRRSPSTSWWPRRSAPSAASSHQAASVVDAPADLPLLRIDHVLISQVLANVLENADRLSPERQRHPAWRGSGSGARGGPDAHAGRDRGGRRGPGHRPRGPRAASSRCSARTAAAAGPASAWPSPRPSSRPTGAHLDRPRGRRTAPGSSSPSRARPSCRAPV